MERSNLLTEILIFLGSTIKAVHGNPLDIEIKYLKDPQNVDEFTLDWVNPRWPDQQKIAESSRARAIFVSEDVEFTSTLKENGKVLIVVESPKLTIAKVGNEFFVTRPIAGIHHSAVIHPQARLGKNLYVGANAYIGNCSVGNNVIIAQNVVIKDDVSIGNNVSIEAGSILGTDGLGCERDSEGILTKFPHFGTVEICDDVEIGANCQIAKGSFSATIIGKGTKINGMCFIAHNCLVGRNVLITGSSMLAGSVKIEDNVTIFSKAIIREHRTIGKGAVIGMGAVVTKDVPRGETWIGNPAQKSNR